MSTPEVPDISWDGMPVCAEGCQCGEITLGKTQVDWLVAKAFAAGRESAYTRDGEIDFVSWDHREHPDCADLDRVISELSDGRIRATNVDDTGSDQYAIAICGRKLEQEEATEAYLAWLRRQWEDDE